MTAPGNVSVDDILTVAGYIYISYSFVYIFLLPVFISVIYVGFQQHWKARSRPATHSDVFTVNMAALEVFVVVSSFIYVFCYFSRLHTEVTHHFNSMTIFGQTVFHFLVCLERFVAVVYPITYLRLKLKGVAMRNVSIVVVWLFSCGMAYLDHLNRDMALLLIFTTGLLSLVAITFFCVCVLFVLIRPGPGDRGGDRGRVDKMKRRAFYTIMAITFALLLKFVSLCLAFMLIFSQVLLDLQVILMSVSIQCFNVPSSLVLPLPFLYRRVKQHQ